ncbi:MAG: hypothetical protein ABGX26_04720 [Nautiliaceae bacterium]
MDKIIDALYKKLLLAVAGGLWFYTIKFFEQNNYLYFILGFLFVALIIIVNDEPIYKKDGK